MGRSFYTYPSRKATLNVWIRYLWKVRERRIFHFYGPGYCPILLRHSPAFAPSTSCTKLRDFFRPTVALHPWTGTSFAFTPPPLTGGSQQSGWVSSFNAFRTFSHPHAALCRTGDSSQHLVLSDLTQPLSDTFGGGVTTRLVERNDNTKAPEHDS